MTMNPRIALVVVLWGLGCWCPAGAQWDGQLEHGGKVTVDPQTNRATVTRDGVSAPLWDGVHRLKERAKSTRPDTMTYTSGQCQQASSDRSFFRECKP